jgi:hypothetical protein
VGALDAALAKELAARGVPSFAMYQLPGQDDEAYHATWGYQEVTHMGRQKVGARAASCSLGRHRSDAGSLGAAAPA